MASPTGHTRVLSSTNIPAHTRSVPMHVHTADLGQGLAAHQQQLTSIPADLPQLLVTTPTTAYSAQSTRSTPGSSTARFSPPPDVPELPPALVMSERSPSPPRFAPPGLANPNLPVLPSITTAGSSPKPKPVQFIVAPKLAKVAVAVTAPTPPVRAFPAGSVSTMSPVVAARTFNARSNARLESPVIAHVANRPDRSAPDRIVARETLFDLDSAGADIGGEDARELDLVDNALPEYIQVYLTPHPDRSDTGKEKRAALDSGDVEYGEKALDEKWDSEAHAVPAYRSTTSLPYRGPATIAPLSLSIAVKARGGGERKSRRCIPAKRSTRVLFVVLLLLIAVVIPAVTIGVVLALRKRGKSDLAQADTSANSNTDASSNADKAATEAGQGVGAPLVFDPAHPTVVFEDGPAATGPARRGLASVPPGGRHHAN